MNKTFVEGAVQRRLAKGMLRQKVFNDLAPRYKGHEDKLARIVAKCPTVKAKRRFEGINYLLILLIGTIIFLDINHFRTLIRMSGDVSLIYDYLFFGKNTEYIAERINFEMLLALPVLIAVNIYFFVCVIRMRGYIYRIMFVTFLLQLLRAEGKLDYAILGLTACISLLVAFLIFPKHGFFFPKKDKEGNYDL